MKTLIASTFAIMLFAGSAFASTNSFVSNDMDHFGTDRYWEQVEQNS